MFFHFRYLSESMGGLREHPPLHGGDRRPRPRGRDRARPIDAQFENSSDETFTETESAFAANFMSLVGDLGALVNGIGLAVCFTILLVTANTMSMAVRERRTEIAVLKTRRLRQRPGDGPGRDRGAAAGRRRGALGIVGALLGDPRLEPRARADVPRDRAPRAPAGGGALRPGRRPRPRPRRRLPARLGRLPGPGHGNAQEHRSRGPAPLLQRPERPRAVDRRRSWPWSGSPWWWRCSPCSWPCRRASRAALRGTGRPDNVMVVSRGSNSEVTSFVELEERNAILDQVPRRARARTDGPSSPGSGSRSWPCPRKSDGRRAPTWCSGPSPRRRSSCGRGSA